jgi:V8-like Glu-specific endopeptidase
MTRPKKRQTSSRATTAADRYRETWTLGNGGLAKIGMKDGFPDHPSPLQSKRVHRSWMTESNGGGTVEPSILLDRQRAMTCGLESGLRPALVPATDPGMPVLEAVFGRDQEWRRHQETASAPWRAVCYLEIRGSTGKGQGTGWMISPDLLVTAGHCIYDANYGVDGKATEIVAYPGRNGSNFPYQPVACVIADAHPKYRGGADPRYDIGVLKLSRKIGIEIGWFGLAVYDLQRAVKSLVNLGGYPTSKAPQGSMWKDAGRIEGGDQHFFHYYIDTEKGMSGAPVFWSDGQQRLALAVHTTWDPAKNINAGVRITGEIMDWIETIKQTA